MTLHRYEPAAIGFLIRHMLVGVLGGMVFGGLMVGFDIAHLRSLAGQSADGILTLLLFFFGLFVTFGSLGMGVGIMGLAQDED